MKIPIPRWRARGTHGFIRLASRSMSVSARTKRATIMPGTSGACATAAPASCSNSRSRPTARPEPRTASQSQSPAVRRGSCPYAAGPERCDHGRRRHRAGRRSAAHLPATRHGETLAGAVVLDTALRLPKTSRLVQTAREVPLWVIAGAGASRAAEQSLLAEGAVVLRAPERGEGLDLAAVLKLLADRGITRLMVEGGPTLAASFVAADLVDEAVLFHSAKISGSDGINALNGMPLAALTQSLHLRRVATHRSAPTRATFSGEGEASVYRYCQ